MPLKLMVVMVDDRREPHVVPFRPAARRGKLFSAEIAGSPHCPSPTSPTNRLGLLSPRLRSTGILPMYVRLARLPQAGSSCCADEPLFPVSLDSDT